VVVVVNNGWQPPATSAPPAAGMMQPLTPTGPDARCTALAGDWSGSLSDRLPNTATMHLEVSGDCRSVRGYATWRSASGGSADATLEGSWDPDAGVFVGRDTELVNVQPSIGGSFCPTDRYTLQLTGDGRLVGRNIGESQGCSFDRPVELWRVR